MTATIYTHRCTMYVSFRIDPLKVSKESLLPATIHPDTQELLGDCLSAMPTATDAREHSRCMHSPPVRRTLGTDSCAKRQQSYQRQWPNKPCHHRLTLHQQRGPFSGATQTAGKRQPLQDLSQVYRTATQLHPDVEVTSCQPYRRPTVVDPQRSMTFQTPYRPTRLPRVNALSASLFSPF